MMIEHAGRLEVLRDTGLLDSLPEESFDRFTRLASALLRSEIALVSLVDDERQFFKSTFGLPDEMAGSLETKLTHSFCKHVVNDGAPLMIDDARLDDRVRLYPTVTKLGVISYLGVPIKTRDGFVLGSLCAINTTPREWSKADLQLLLDLAEMLTTEIEFRDRTAALKESFELANADEEARRQYLRALVHDLRSPVGAITTCVEQLRGLDPGDTESMDELSEICKESSDQILTMLDELLDFEKISAGSSILKSSRFSIVGVVRQAVRLLIPFAEEAKLPVSLSIPDKPVIILGDKDKLHRVVRNLLDNAIKYSPSQTGISVVVDIVSHADKPQCRIRVIDRGQGIPDAEKESIFGHFMTGSATKLRGQESYGIGLAFCKAVVLGHGGAIAAEDTPGGGCTIVVVLPLAGDDDGSADTTGPV